MANIGAHSELPWEYTSATMHHMQLDRRIPFFFGVLGLMAWIGLSQQSTKPVADSNAPKPPATATPNVTKLVVPTEGHTGFESLNAAKAGLVPKVKYQKPEKNLIRQTGNSGLAAGDVDGDGLVDLFVCGMDAPNVLYRNKGNWQFEDITIKAGVICKGWRMSGAVFSDVDGDNDLDLITVSLRDGRNFLFLNDGKGKFTESLGIDWVVRQRGGSVASALADVDGDGDLDLYVTGFLRSFDLTVVPPQIRARALKVMNDMVELAEKKNFPLSKRDIQLELSRECREYYTIRHEWEEQGVRLFKMAAHHTPDVLYLNDGRGNFRAVTDADAYFLDEDGRPMTMPHDPSHEPAFRDVDGDGDPDLYICSDFEFPDRFWMNDGTGRFRLINRLAVRHTSQFSMGVDFTDLNRDGHLDFLTVDMLSRDHKRRKTQMGMMSPTPAVVGLVDNRPQIMQNTLFLNRGDNTWTEIAQFAGLKASEWSWATVFTDVDLDGYEDLLISTGMTRDFMDSDSIALDKKRSESRSFEQDISQGQGLAGSIDMNSMFPTLETPNVAFRNRGDMTFEDVSEKWGFKTEAVSGGMALADFDNDGDLDVIINNDGAPLEVYRNETTAPRIAVRLIGRAPNTQAIGAKVRLIGGPGGPAPQEQEIHCGSGYASGSDTLAVFGTGDKTTGLKLEVTWRSGSKTVVDEIKPNHRYVIQETNVVPASKPKEQEPNPLFSHADQLLALAKLNYGPLAPGHYHIDKAFDDFKHQSLLPNRLSQLGPSVAWTDINGDGREDLVVGVGTGGKSAIFQGQTNGGFVVDFGPTSKHDAAGIVGWTAAPGKPALLTGVSNFEAEGAAGIPSVRIIQPNPQKQFTETHVLPGGTSTTGPLTVADVDSDGDLDLFVGGRTIPGRYPEPADSKLYLNNDGTLELDKVNAITFKKLGLVSGAVFGDLLDNDGDADLAVALEWGPVRVFRNNAGKFTDITAALGLDAHTGWWNSVTLGDLDGDGRLDLVAGNWGLNSKYQQSYDQKNPLRISYGDFDKNGVLDIVEYHFDTHTGKLVPERGRSCTSRAMSFIGELNPTYNTFGSRSLEEIYGACLKEGTVVEANTLAHMVFFNRGAKFETQQMPTKAQFAPVFGVNVADFDGDGNEDVFVAQNFFASQIETPRSDGGRGLLMLGDGQGGLKPMPGHESGLIIYGEQRGSAVGDFDADGRPDLVVSQNGTLTRLFRNALAKPGLRVHLDAGEGNPSGVGAVVQLKFEGDKLGPARAVTAGSGYWSQDSATLILAMPTRPTHIEVRWPGGKTTSTQLPKNASEITVNTEGKLIASE
jgi:hypothetical protein